MEIKQTFNQALAKDLNRREFLTQTGLVIVTLIGVTRLLRSLRESYGSRESAGDMSSAYGGNRAPGQTFSTTNPTSRDN